MPSIRNRPSASVLSRKGFGSSFPEYRSIVTTTPLKGLPSAVIRPLIEAVAERLSGCCGCALATVKTAGERDGEKIRNRVNRTIVTSLRVAEKQAQITR